MMSALAMILTAAMAVPGDRPEMESGEIKQGLDLSGEWEGTWHCGKPTGVTGRVHISGNKISIAVNGALHSGDFRITDEGANRIRLMRNSLGIYRRDGDRIVICYGAEEYPTSFQPGNGQFLLILRRVKPGK